MEEIYQMFQSENLKERYHLENQGSRWNDNIKIEIKRHWSLWTVFIVASVCLLLTK